MSKTIKLEIEWQELEYEYEDTAEKVFLILKWLLAGDYGYEVDDQSRTVMRIHTARGIKVTSSERRRFEKLLALTQGENSDE